MKDVLVLVISRGIAGVMGILLFIMIKESIIPGEYIGFSKIYTSLILIGTFGGGAISGLMLKKSLLLKELKAMGHIWFLFFFLVSSIIIEFMIYSDYINSNYRLLCYLFCVTNMMMCIASVDYQIRLKFYGYMFLELLKNIIPVVIIFFYYYILKRGFLSTEEITILFIIANIYGLYYFIVNYKIKRYSSAFYKAYFYRIASDDLKFVFWFNCFNAFVQFFIMYDRNIIGVTFDKIKASKLAYTADQTMKVFNGLLFPINTKVSSEIGHLMKKHKLEDFYKLRFKAQLMTFFIGGVLVLILGIGVGQVDTINNKISLDYYFAYSIGTVIYLTALINQKIYDYTSIKFVPFILLVTSFLLGYYFFVQYFGYNLYLFVTLVYLTLLYLIDILIKTRDYLIEDVNKKM